MKFSLTLITLLSSFAIAFAQNNTIDSLEDELQKTKEDTNKVNLFNLIGKKFAETGNYDNAFKYTIDAKTLAEKVRFQRGLGVAINNIGVIYWRQGNLTEALRMLYSSLKVREEIRDLKGISDCYINIGIIYAEQKNFSDAQKNYSDALKIKEQIGDKEATISCYLNISTVYVEQHEEKLALQSCQMALKISMEIRNKSLLAYSYAQMGTLYSKSGNNDKAFEMFLSAVEVFKENGDKDGLANSYLNIGNEFGKLKKFKDASDYMAKALKLAHEIGDKDLLRDCYENMAEYADSTNDYKNAYLYHKLFSDVKDSILNESSTKLIAEMKTKYETEKKDKELEIQTIKIDKQKLTVRYLIAGISLLGIFAWISLYLYNQKKKAAFLQQVSETKMKALRAQMNPHFIYNSLNSVYQFMQGNDYKSAGEYLISFSKLIRTILENSLHKEVSLADELKALELFLSLEATRLNNKFVYEINVADDIDKDNTLIPPLLLEPFIENSIWHGFRDKEGLGKITLSISKKEETMICIIQDNGIGRQRSSELKAMMNTEKRESVGMKLTEERITIINQIINSKAQVLITDLFDEIKQPAGVKVELSLPLLLND